MIASMLLFRIELLTLVIKVCFCGVNYSVSFLFDICYSYAKTVLIIKITTGTLLTMFPVSYMKVVRILYDILQFQKHRNIVQEVMAYVFCCMVEAHYSPSPPLSSICLKIHGSGIDYVKWKKIYTNRPTTKCSIKYFSSSHFFCHKMYPIAINFKVKIFSAMYCDNRYFYWYYCSGR